MSASRLPLEREFATGNQGTTLVLIVCAGWLWAGLYAGPYSTTPVEVSAAPTLTATAGARRLIVGGTSYALSPSSLQSARRWLDRNGVVVRNAPSPKSPT